MISPSWIQLLAVENRLFNFDMPKVFGVPLSTILPFVLAIVGFALGIWFANAIRMREYGWKVGLILSCWLVGLSVVLLGDYKLGVDLQGGVILVYQVDEKETAALDPMGRTGQWEMSALTEVLARRLNPDGLKEIVIRPFGRDQVEIVVPEADEAEINLIKRRITTGGALRFMIVANDRTRDADVIEAAERQAEQQGENLSRDVRDEQGNIVGYWARAARENVEDPTSPFREKGIMGDIIRDARTGKIIDLTPQQRAQFPSSAAFSQFLADRGIKQIDVLMKYDPDYDIKGSDLGPPGKGFEPGTTRPMILFSTRGEGVSKMAGLTQENIGRKMGIVFDNEVLSAPVIQSRIAEQGNITGDFTQKEVDFMVEILRSGSMPVVLYKNPISENQIGSILGRDTIEQGTYSIAISLLIVLGFTWFYYRFAGFVACLALILNLVLTVAIMVMLRAPFTLPGLAGLVLTVGMSVDANVLIFERMREEKEKGAALRSAIRNGFDRAMVTVIDSNLTTLLTAIVLYAIGTDQVRGFGITLILGILTSMFTAIFMARVIFEIGERKRWIKDLTMIKLFETLNVDWVKLFGPATIASVVLIVLGLVATVARGKGLFDIDLAGGTSVTFVLEEPVPEAELRKKLDESFSKITNEATNSRVDFSVNEVTMQGQPAETVWKVDSSLEEVETLQEVLTKTFTVDERVGLKTYELKIADLRTASAPVIHQGEEALETESPSAGTPASSGEKAGDKADGGKAPEAKSPPAEEPAAKIGAPDEKAAPAETPPASDTPPPSEPAAEEAKSDDAKSDDAKPAEAKADSDKADADKADADKSDEGKSDEGKTDEPATEEGKASEEKSARFGRTGEVYLTSFLLQDEEAPKTEGDAPPAESEKADAEKADAEKADADKPADAPAPEAPAAEAPAATAEAPAAETPVEGAAPAAEAAPGADADAAAAADVWTVAELNFTNTAVTAEAVIERVSEVARQQLKIDPAVVVDNENWNRTDNDSFNTWTVSINLPEDQAKQVFDTLQRQLDTSPIWQTSSKIGGQVSSDTRLKALTAVAFSLLGILAYVWFRFQRLSWGIAAIAALVHDSLIMLGGIAASYWLAGPLGFLGVEEFKISLPVIAAFLTLIGYSINDTIVIFDRIREIRGKNPNVTLEMINAAVNQTMSRTILTGGLTLVVIVILYFFGGPGIHAFAFSLVIGCIAGIYSTVFIASPMLLWLMREKKPEGTKAGNSREMARST